MTGPGGGSAGNGGGVRAVQVDSLYTYSHVGLCQGGGGSYNPYSGLSIQIRTDSSTPQLAFQFTVVPPVIFASTTTTTTSTQTTTSTTLPAPTSTVVTLVTSTTLLSSTTQDPLSTKVSIVFVRGDI